MFSSKDNTNKFLDNPIHLLACLVVIEIRWWLCLLVFAALIVFSPADLVSAGRPVAHFMPVAFFTYERPDVSSAIVSFHQPQTVVLIETNASGWAKIHTYAGDAWIQMFENDFLLPRTFGLHYYFGQESYSSTISPRTVRINDVRDGWLLIGTGLGNRWINLDFQPNTDSLEAFLHGLGNNFAVFYMDINSGHTFMYNEDRVFSAASVNKVQHALYLFSRAERGELDMARVHTFREGDVWGGTGVIQNMAFGTTFTTRELLRHSIRSSDNIAFRLLVRSYGLSGYLDFVRELGADESLVRNITGSRITARDAGIWALEIYNYIGSGGTYSAGFRTDLMNTNMRLVTSAYPIASKYGWWERYFHDLAIVFAPNPYILVILSDAPEASFATFRDISARVQSFHRTYFGR